MPVVFEGAGEQGPIAASRIGSLATEAEYIAQSGQEQLPEGLPEACTSGRAIATGANQLLHEENALQTRHCALVSSLLRQLALNPAVDFTLGPRNRARTQLPRFRE